MGYSPLACRGAEVWSDDFDDGDFDGWTICENWLYDSGSNWSATNYYLQCTQSDSGIISHLSDTAYGTWICDFKVDEAQVELGTYASIVFISSNLDGATDDLACYWISFSVGSTSEGYIFAPSLEKYKDTDGATIANSETHLPVAGWHHIEVTRTTGGLFSVYHNGSLILQGTDTDIDTSELFSFWTSRWSMFDNIVVDDAPPIDWLLIGVAGLSAVVIVAVLVIILKRR
jgi:hypothetical protein